MAATVASREPDRFTVGDTLAFQRFFRDYLPSAGWAMLYEIRGGASAVEGAVEFTSTDDGDYHRLNVPAEVTAAWLPGDFTLVGYVVHAELAERHQVYLGELTLIPDLGTGTDDAAVKSFDAEMIEAIQAQLLRLAAHELDDSTVQGAEFRRAKRTELEGQLKYHRERQAYLEDQMRIRNGLSSNRLVAPTFRITGP